MRLLSRKTKRQRAFNLIESLSVVEDMNIHKHKSVL